VVEVWARVNVEFGCNIKDILIAMGGCLVGNCIGVYCLK